MAHIARFRQAEEDMLAIAAYIAADNPAAAASWLDKIEKPLELLARQPNLGEAVNHIRPGLRRMSQGYLFILFDEKYYVIIFV
jgi:plasmid stabilization system protein ParE